MKRYLKLIEKSRLKKFNQFMSFCKPDQKDKILDVGATNKEYRTSDNFLDKKYPFKNRITVLGIEKYSDFSKRYPKIKVVTYDGKIFPFKDNTFDFIWSNAVIEHVGGKLRQEIFISEMLRVAKRKIVFTTPNGNFPIEVHTRVPFVHWLNKQTADWFYIKLDKKWAIGDYMNLLNRKKLVNLLTKIKDQHHFDYKIINNKLLGLTSTFTVLINKAQDEISY